MELILIISTHRVEQSFKILLLNLIVKYFKVLMTYKPDLTNVDNFGQSVLFDAVEGGNLNIVNEVLKKIKRYKYARF